MNKFLVMFLFFIPSLSVQAMDIQSYDSRIEVGTDGAAEIKVSLSLKGVQAGRMVVPVGSSGLDDFKVLEVPADVQLTPLPGMGGGQATLIVDVIKAGIETIKLRFSYRIMGFLERAQAAEGKKLEMPADSSLVTHRFINTQAIGIDNYRVELVLPERVRVQLIREQLPKPKKSEVLPRVRLEGFNGRQGGLLQITKLKQGDRTSMILEAVDDQRSFGWLLVGLALAVGYLITFMNLVSTKSKG